MGLIQPYAHLKGQWENFLLACINCNSTKGDKDVVLNELLLPDRDNTFIAYDYVKDGTVSVAVTGALATHAAKTLSITGLDKAATQNIDSNKKAIALERVGQRMQAWLLVLSTKQDVDADPNNQHTRNCAVRTALAHGFFSIWMKVFENDVDMRKRLIDAFRGTAGSGCFDAITTAPIAPAPNPDGLADGGKL
ncbi:MAG: HNH endonuclease [Cytophagaceae bacterium]|nr:MAG: HNH endonuclease [Cytophagaceae bacterium]